MQNDTIITKRSSKTEINSTVDSDQTEWITPPGHNFAEKIPARSHAHSFRGKDLRGRSLSGAHLMMADLNSVIASDVSFSGADLSFADLQGADLRGSNFSKADLCKANFRGADLRGADLTNALTEDSDFVGALYDSYTQLPFSLDEANRRGLQNRTCV